ncbi:MAG TPA: hypothetical protein PKE16_00260 [Hyphomicrobium sp.]|nr:hypothetical protein [Hyphomicrobium sp.]
MNEQEPPNSALWPFLALVGFAMLGIVYIAIGSGRSILAYAIGFGILLAALLATFIATAVVGWITIWIGRYLRNGIREKS